jgi:protein-tyrosine phosphatase
VVNCTDTLANYHQGAFYYLRFPVASWPSFGDVGELRRFLQPLWDFLDEALSKGVSVLVHCLAGAHRAGTTGCLILMRYAAMSAEEAVDAARTLRPVIDPIGRFPQLLCRYQHVRENDEQRARKKAAAIVEQADDPSRPPSASTVTVVDL